MSYLQTSLLIYCLDLKSVDYTRGHTSISIIAGSPT